MYINIKKALPSTKRNGRLSKVIAHEDSRKFQVMQKGKRWKSAMKIHQDGMFRIETSY